MWLCLRWEKVAVLNGKPMWSVDSALMVGQLWGDKPH